jgi:hypothetical protein
MCAAVPLRQVCSQYLLVELNPCYKCLLKSPFHTQCLHHPFAAQEIKAGDVDRTRNLFERATSLSLPPKRMKFLFKRYV